MTTMKTRYVLRATRPGFGLGLFDEETGTESYFNVSNFVSVDGPRTRNLNKAALYSKKTIEAWIDEYEHMVEDGLDNPEQYAKFKSVEVVERTDVYLKY